MDSGEVSPHLPPGQGEGGLEPPAGTKRQLKWLQLALAVAAGVIVVLGAGVAYVMNEQPRPVVTDSAPPVPVSEPVLEEPQAKTAGSSDDFRSMVEKTMIAPVPGETSVGQFRGIRETSGDIPPQPSSAQAPSAIPTSEQGGGLLAQPLPPEKLVRFRGRRRHGSATLTIETSPPGAQVIFDGVTIEQAPVTFENIPAGEHQLILRSEELGLRAVHVIDVRADQNWTGLWSFREKRWVSRN